jgi:hypothetical protein
MDIVIFKLLLNFTLTIVSKRFYLYSHFTAVYDTTSHTALSLSLHRGISVRPTLCASRWLTIAPPRATSAIRLLRATSVTAARSRSAPVLWIGHSSTFGVVWCGFWLLLSCPPFCRFADYDCCGLACVFYCITFGSGSALISVFLFIIDAERFFFISLVLTQLTLTTQIHHLLKKKSLTNCLN